MKVDYDKEDLENVSLGEIERKEQKKREIKVQIEHIVRSWKKGGLTQTQLRHSLLQNYFTDGIKEDLDETDMDGSSYVDKCINELATEGKIELFKKPTSLTLIIPKEKVTDNNG